MRTTMEDSILEMASQSEAAVDLAKVKPLADVLVNRSVRPFLTKWDDPLFWNVDANRSDRCQLLAVGNSINFRFWSAVERSPRPMAGEIDGTEFVGSTYMWRRLRVAVERQEFSLESKFLKSLTVKEFTVAFVDDRGFLPLKPAIDDRVANLRDLGDKLDNSWAGHFSSVVDAVGGSMVAFTKLSSAFRAFDDPLMKLTMLNAIMLQGSGLASFDEEPMPAVDYHLIKQAVRQGLVIPPHSVYRKLEVGELLDEDEGLDLRKATLSGLLMVARQANLSPALLDNVYWFNRLECKDEFPTCLSADSDCPFRSACSKRIEIGRPMELTRYY